MYTLAKDSKSRSVRSSSCTKRVERAIETNDQCPKDMSNKNEKSAWPTLLAPKCEMQKSYPGKMPNR